MSFVPGGNVYDVFVTGGTGVQSVQAGTGIDTTPGQNPQVSNTGVVSVTGGAGISTNFPDGNITLTNTGVIAIQPGAGIIVDNTNPQQPIVSSTEISDLTAGAGISIAPVPTPQNPTISNTGVLSLSATAPLSVSSATGAVTVTNNGILGVQSGTGISVTTGQNPTINNTGVLSIIAEPPGLSSSGTGNITLTNKGVLNITSGTGISVDNTNPQQPIIANAGVIDVKAGAGISIDSSNPTQPIVSYTGSAGDDNVFAGWAGSTKQPTGAYSAGGGTDTLTPSILPTVSYDIIPTVDPFWMRIAVPNPFGNVSAPSATSFYATLAYFNGIDYVEHPSAIPYRQFISVPSGSSSLANINSIVVEGLAPTHLAGQTVSITSTNGWFQLSQETVSPPPPIQPFVRFGRGQIPPGIYPVGQLQNLIRTAIQAAVTNGLFSNETGGSYNPTVTVNVTSVQPLTYTVNFSSFIPQPNPNGVQNLTFDNSTVGTNTLNPQQVADSTALFGWSPPNFRPIPTTITGNLPPNGLSSVNFTIGLVSPSVNVSVSTPQQFISYSAKPVNTQW